MPTISAPQATQTSGPLMLSTEWLDATMVRINAAGDIDAANAGELADYVFRRAANCKRMVLDMSEVSFFGTAGFTTLRIIDFRCSRAGVMWSLVPSRAILRVLDICDPRHSLPIETA